MSNVTNTDQTSPTLLAIDTATEQGSVSLWRQGRYVSSDWQGGEKHVESTLSHIKVMLEDTNTSLADIDAIVFSQGPGSFTGLRAGCGITQGLALAHNTPVIAVPTLMMLAEASGQHCVLCLLDARMDQVYAAVYQKLNGLWHELVTPGLYQPHELPALPKDVEMMVGNGVDHYLDVLTQSHTTTHLPYQLGVSPHARYLLPIALDKWQRQDLLTPSEALPVYIRDKVALTTEERRAR